jgi:hypothetical protein
MSVQNGFTRAEKEAIVTAAVERCLMSSENDWANLAQVGAAIRESGLKYGKLIKFLNSFSNILEMRVDYKNDPPIVYVKLK